MERKKRLEEVRDQRERDEQLQVRAYLHSPLPITFVCATVPFIVFGPAYHVCSLCVLVIPLLHVDLALVPLLLPSPVRLVCITALPVLAVDRDLDPVPAVEIDLIDKSNLEQQTQGWKEDD